MVEGSQNKVDREAGMAALVAGYVTADCRQRVLQAGEKAQLPKAVTTNGFCFGMTRFPNPGQCC